MMGALRKITDGVGHFLRDRPALPPRPPTIVANGTHVCDGSIDKAYWGKYGLLDIGDERWRFQDGALVAYFHYVPKGHDTYPWGAVWMAGGYDG